MCFSFFFFFFEMWLPLLSQLIKKGWLLVRMNRAAYNAKLYISCSLGKKQLAQTNGLNEDTIYICVGR